LGKFRPYLNQFAAATSPPQQSFEQACAPQVLSLSPASTGTR
jgi:hypothetical protein